VIDRDDPVRRRVAWGAAALVAGAAGGAVFHQFQIPLAWMGGAMTATAALSLAGVPLAGPTRLRGVMIAVLGIMLGSAFTPGTLARAGGWLPSMVVLIVCVVVLTLVVARFLRRTCGFDPVTAFFAAAPGGFAAMVVTGGALGGDERSISLVHSVRLMLTVLLIPFWFRLFDGYVPGMAAPVEDGLSLLEALFLAAAAVAGTFGAGRLRIPAAALVGPMVLSGGAHVSGLIQAAPPDALVALAQVVIGTSVGCRFAGVSVGRVVTALTAGALATLAMLAVAVAAALAMAALTGLSFPALLLAYAPGGVPEMALVSLALGIDPAFVASHHLVRIFFLAVVMPYAFRRLGLGMAGPS
jgi:membrane AbrB-like protein